MLTVSIDSYDVERRLSHAQRQIPFVMMKTINTTILQVQEAERLQLDLNFTLRRQTWAHRSVKISHFARKTELWADLGISPPGRPERADILSKFENAGRKLPQSRHIAVPIDVKRNKSDIVTRSQRPKAFQFTRARSSPRTRVSVYYGRNRTFMVQFPDGRGWILKRVGRRGRGKFGRLFEGTKVLYVLTTSVPIPERLDWYDVATVVVRAQLQQNFFIAFENALRTAR